MKHISAPSFAQLGQRRLAGWHHRGRAKRTIRQGQQPFPTTTVMQEWVTRRIPLHHVPLELKWTVRDEAKWPIQQHRRQQKRILVAMDQAIELTAELVHG